MISPEETDRLASLIPDEDKEELLALIGSVLEKVNSLGFGKMTLSLTGRSSNNDLLTILGAWFPGQPMVPPLFGVGPDTSGGRRIEGCNAFIVSQVAKGMAEQAPPIQMGDV